ncbi:hypothetical protein B0A49_12295 [Cryomyces minteri]|uniref:GH16 domain-containing protein n=1 Tax=Cryomyces minteri TaxID=331657 RepID=A0A4U0VV30_9PEZI|nr:hypothetical protein B0A49_12295 [Cryomyces minteri]
MYDMIVVVAKCACGYSVNATSASAFSVFTDLLETDFLHVYNLSGDIGWQRQEYNVTPQVARGTYGKKAELRNVVANPLNSSYDYAGSGALGGDPGLQLWVRGDSSDGMVGMGEIVAIRTDMLYGSFRVGMKMTAIPGTCGAFFWFRNDTQEIDMEFLSAQFNATSNPVSLVLQSPASEAAGYNAQGTPNFQLHPLPFSPDKEYHEYRFDWLADRVSFYADGQWLADMSASIPNSPGHLVLNHWSNGDKYWSAGPPQSDAVLTVSYVKAYFNSSTPARQLQYNAACPAGQNSLAQVCQVPDQSVAPNPAGRDGNTTAHTYFFTQHKDMTVNQTVYAAGTAAV